MNTRIVKMILLLSSFFLLTSPMPAQAQGRLLKGAEKLARTLVKKTAKPRPARTRYAATAQAKKIALDAAKKRNALLQTAAPARPAQPTAAAKPAQPAAAAKPAQPTAAHQPAAQPKRKKGRVKNAALERINRRREEAALNRLSQEVGERVSQRASQQRKARQIAHAKKTNNPDKVKFRMKDALTDIIARNPKDIMAAWAQMNALRIKRGAANNPDFFQQFATLYYKENLHTLTPHMYQFFGQVGRARSPRLEKEVLGRIKELLALKKELMAQVFPGGQESRLRLRYLKNLESVNGEAFDPKALIFSYEQKLTDSYNAVSIRHIKPNSVLRIGRNKYPVADFNGSLDDILELYKFLLDKKSAPEGITALFDPKTKQLALYSKDKKVWLRVTPHEYSSLNRLHIHVNEIKNITLVVNGHHTPQSVMFNVFVPISPMFGNSMRQGKEADFYQKMILAPVEALKNTPGVNVITGSIF